MCSKFLSPLFQTCIYLRKIIHKKLVIQFDEYIVFFYIRSSFSEFAAKYAKDERFKGIEKMREREALFSDFCSDLRRKEKEEKSLQKEKVGYRKRRKLLCG